MENTTVLLATFNGKQWVRDQISTVLNQDNVNLRIVIGDDVSTDGTLEWLKENISDERIEYLNFDQRSGSAGQNFIRMLKEVNLKNTNYLAFSDQDDLWDSGKLAVAIKALQKHNAQGYSSAVTAFWPSGKKLILTQSPRITNIDFLFEGAGQGCTFVIRGDLALEIQNIIREGKVDFSGLHYHDWLIYAISRTLKKTWIFDPVPSMQYRQHAENDTGARGSLASVKKRLLLIRDGWYKKQVQCMLEIVTSINPTAVSSDFICTWKNHGFSRRLRLSSILIKYGRRRFSDRVVLAFSALAGWL